MQTKTYHELQGEEILSQVFYEEEEVEERSLFGLWLSIGCIVFWGIIVYFIIH